MWRMIWRDPRWQMFVIALVTAAAGELKVSPFHEESFRIALGSITFLFLLLLSRSLSYVRIGWLTGMVVLLFRMLQDLLFGTGDSLDVSFWGHLPASVFYILYGAGMSLIRRRLDDFNPLRVGVPVAAIDFVSNSTELLIRKLLSYPNAFWINEWLYLLGIAVVRSYVVIGMYSTLVLRQLQLVHAEQNKRMEQMLTIGVGLYGEVFYLKKSIEATEGIMAKSYKLYQQLKGSDRKEQSNQALRIAQEIHEVKKDSQRILAGLIKLFDKEITVDLQLLELMDHAVRANEKYSEMLGKEVVFRRDSDVDFPVMHEIPLLTLLNNLLANAVEAIDGKGVVMVRVYQTSNDDTVFQITDSGHGIPTEVRSLIFEPGFTTKFDKLGSASIGIGLSHARDIVDFFGGMIHVDAGPRGKGVLIDLLMGDQDGMESIAQLRAGGFHGKFIMISQVVDKEMVGQAYQTGIEFFIHKPINKLEIRAVLEKVNGQLKLDRSLHEIRKSLASLEQGTAQAEPVVKERTVRDAAYPMMMDMGVTGESGSKDIIAIMEYLVDRGEHELPSLQELYEAIAAKYRQSDKEIARESKAIEQRIRRTALAALTHLASLGLTDYSHPKFEHYAPMFFDFQEVRLRMKEIDEEAPTSKGKVSIKKFLQAFYWDLSGKMEG